MIDKSKYKFLILFTVIALTIILVSCGTSNSNLPTVSFTKIITQTPLPMATNTLTPTHTMEPTLAFWATAQESGFNQNHTQIAETKKEINNLLTQFPQQVCGFGIEDVFLSHDGKWVANDCRYSSHEFRIFSKVDETVWVIPYPEVFEYYPEFLGSVDALHWSKNGEYLYFSNNSCCANTDAISNGDNLYKLDLKTGKWVLIVSGVFNYYSFSPDSEKLIYILKNAAGANESLDLHVLDIDSGNEEVISIGSFEMGLIVWKNDSQKISVITQIGNIFDDNRKYSLVSVDLQNKKLQTIILNSQNWLGIQDWSDDDILTIRQTKAVEYNGYYINTREIVIYDLKTKKFITQ